MNDPRVEIAETCRHLAERGLIVAGDGNASIRIAENVFCVTPSGVTKGRLRPDQVLTVNGEGALLQGKGRPSAEYSLHQACYRHRPDIRAVLHAHPPHAIAASLVGLDLTQPLLSEVILDLGEIRTLPYLPPTTQAIADQVGDAVASSNAVILARHGAVAVGETLEQALNRMETLEHAARIVGLAHQLGRPVPLDASELAELEALRDRLSD